MAYSYQKYEESDAVRKAQQALADQEGRKPGQYQSQWQSRIDDTMDRILNRKPFQYDVNQDALYQQYKDQYVRNGKLAMQDTMGQAAALTGGYGNSYAQSVGQQTYQGYLTGLTDKIPELYQLALAKYQTDGDALKEQYALLGDREQQDYGRYQDALAAWQSDRNYLADQYNQERTWDYGKYTDDRNYDYSVWQDNAARAQAQVEYLLSIGVTPSDELLEASGLDKQYTGNRISQWQAAQAAAAASGSGGKRPSALKDWTGTVNGKTFIDQDDARAFAQSILSSGGSQTDAVKALVNEGANQKDAEILVKHLQSSAGSSKRTSSVGFPNR